MEGLLNSREVADKLKITEAALAQMRYLGEGPVYVRIGRRVRYREDDIARWLAASVVKARKDL